MKIAVVALGKIGLPLAVQFASKGHDVVGVDVNPQVVELVNAATEPFPGEAHGLLGSTDYGKGGGFLAGAGYYWNEFRFELGAGGLWLVGDRSLNVSAQVSRTILPWFHASIFGQMTRNSPLRVFWRFSMSFLCHSRCRAPLTALWTTTSTSRVPTK